MSMHKFCGGGPIMAGLAAMVEMDSPIEPMGIIKNTAEKRLWHLSVPIGSNTIHTIIMATSEAEARARAQADDPCWSKPEVQFHDSFDNAVFIGDDSASRIAELEQRLAAVEKATMPQDMDAVIKRVKGIEALLGGYGMIPDYVGPTPSIADQVFALAEKQKREAECAKNAVWRQMVDNAYLTGVGQQQTGLQGGFVSFGQFQPDRPKGA